MKAKTYASVILIVLVTAIIVFPFWYNRELLKAYSFKVYAVTPDTVKPLTEHDKIVAYIRQVFGGNSDNALKVAECESRLRPDAVNDNTQWGGVGIDRGIFQLNNVFQRIDNPNFLFDWKINIDMAYVIFKDSGYNWHLWSCGKYLGL